MAQTPSKCQSPSSTPKREQLETWLWLDLWRHLSERGRIGDAIGSADTTRVTAETSWSFGRATTYTCSPVLYVVPDTSCIRPHTQVNVLSASSQIFFSESRTTKLIEIKRRRSYMSHTHTHKLLLYIAWGVCILLPAKSDYNIALTFHRCLFGKADWKGIPEQDKCFLHLFAKFDWNLIVRKITRILWCNLAVGWRNNVCLRFSAGHKFNCDWETLGCNRRWWLAIWTGWDGRQTIPGISCWRKLSQVCHLSRSSPWALDTSW